MGFSKKAGNGGNGIVKPAAKRGKMKKKTAETPEARILAAKKMQSEGFNEKVIFRMTGLSIRDLKRKKRQH